MTTRNQPFLLILQGKVIMANKVVYGVVLFFLISVTRSYANEVEGRIVALEAGQFRAVSNSVTAIKPGQSVTIIWKIDGDEIEAGKGKVKTVTKKYFSVTVLDGNPAIGMFVQVHVDEPAATAPVATTKGKQSATLQTDTTGDATKDTMKAQIEHLLAVCNAHLKANRLTSGQTGNAFECYQKVLLVDEHNRLANTGIKNIADRYNELTIGAIDQNKLDLAERYLDKLVRVDPKYSGIKALRLLIRKEREGFVEQPTPNLDQPPKDLSAGTGSQQRATSPDDEPNSKSAILTKRSDSNNVNSLDLMKPVDWNQQNFIKKGQAMSYFALAWNKQYAKKFGEALKLYRKSATMGYSKAQYSIGWFYENGLSVPRNLTVARHWYKYAAAQGEKSAIMGLQRLNKLAGSK